MDMLDFFAQNPVFTFKEFVGFQQHERTGNLSTIKNTLQYYIKKDRLLHVHKGLYAFVPHGYEVTNYPVDPLLIASKLADDAVIAYHSALEYHGIAYSVYFYFYFVSDHRISSFSYGGHTFVRLPVPKILQKKKQPLFGVIKAERMGVDIQLTGLERTFVDVLARPEISGGWEEVWRSFEHVAVLDLDKTIEYTLLLDNATTAAKVGFFLEYSKATLGVSEKQLKILEKHSPKKPHYINAKKPSKFVKRWSLMIPTEILERRWEEPFV